MGRKRPLREAAGDTRTPAQRREPQAGAQVRVTVMGREIRYSLYRCNHRGPEAEEAGAARAHAIQVSLPSGTPRRASGAATPAPRDPWTRAPSPRDVAPGAQGRGQVPGVSPGAARGRAGAGAGSENWARGAHVREAPGVSL